jgi:hypothetical protein
MTLKPGYTASYSGGPIYTDLKTLLREAKEGYIELKGEGELFCVDNPQERLIGFQLYITDKVVMKTWDFMMSVDDYKACIKKDSSLAHLTTAKGRLEWVTKIKAIF